MTPLPAGFASAHPVSGGGTGPALASAPRPDPFAPLAITLDLDDTVWPIGPVIERAEARLVDWLAAAAPATLARWGAEGLRRLRAEIGRLRPDLRHDLTALRRLSLQEALETAGDDPALADPAFEVFFAARQEVDPYPEAVEALARLAARFPVLGLTNGNADLARIGLAPHFVGCLSARELGVAKPDPRVFAAACERLGLPPAQVLHVGDDWAMDVLGARGAGQPAVWVRRADHAGAAPSVLPPGVHRVADLAELARWLGV